jgi:hypothetical protein
MDIHDFTQTANALMLYEGIVDTFVQLFLSQVSAVMALSLPLTAGRCDESLQKEDAMEQPHGRSRRPRNDADAGNAQDPTGAIAEINSRRGASK